MGSTLKFQGGRTIHEILWSAVASATRHRFGFRCGISSFKSKHEIPTPHSKAERAALATALQKTSFHSSWELLVLVGV
jgi:hypothetical protein